MSLKNQWSVNDEIYNSKKFITVETKYCLLKNKTFELRQTINLINFKYYGGLLCKMDDSGRFCPIVGKVSLDPGEPLPIDSAEKHECLICFRYQENTNLLEQNSHSLRMKLYTFFR